MEGSSPSSEPPAFDADADEKAPAPGEPEHDVTPPKAPDADADAGVGAMAKDAAQQAHQRVLTMSTFLSEIDPVLSQYANTLCESGFETPKLFSYARMEDLERLGIPLGHQRALDEAARSLRGTNELVVKPLVQQPYVVNDGQHLMNIQQPHQLNKTVRSNPRNVKEMGKIRRDMLISALVFMGVSLLAEIIELIMVGIFCVNDSYQCEEYVCSDGSCRYEYYYCDYDLYCTNTVTTAAGSVLIFMAFVFTMVALRVPCVTGFCGAAFVAPPIVINESRNTADEGCCTDSDACASCCLAPIQEEPPVGKKRPKMMHFKTALRSSYVLAFMSLPLGWWYGELPIEIFVAAEMRFIAFVLLTVTDCL